MAWCDCGLLDERGQVRPGYTVRRESFGRPLDRGNERSPEQYSPQLGSRPDRYENMVGSEMPQAECALQRVTDCPIGMPGRFRQITAQVILSTIFLSLLTGCFDTKQEITLNPDGSGKVVMESTFAEFEPLLANKTPSNPEESAGQAMRRLIENAEGVEAWRDVSFRELEDGRLFVRATAYFTDLSKFKTELNSFLRFKVMKDAAGQLSIEPKTDTSRSPIRIPDTDETVTAETLRHERKKFRAMKPLLTASLGTMKLDTIFHVSGVVRRTSNFETNAPHSLRLRFDGARLLATIEDVFFDPEIARHLLVGGSAQGALISNHFANEKLYGTRAPVVAVIKPGTKPLFDYAAEVAEAKKAFPALAQSLGISGASLQSKLSADRAKARVTVKGVSLRFDGNKPGALFENLGHGYIISLNADLPVSVSDIGDAKLTRAITVEGVDLLPQAADSDRSRWTTLSSGRTNVSFDVELREPPLNSKGLAEVAGYLDCGSADNHCVVELFSGKIRPGEKGKEFDTEIEYVGPNTSSGEKLVVNTHLDEGQVLSFKVVGDAGQTTVLQRQGLMKFASKRSYTLVATGVIPRSGKLVADIVTGSQRVRIPFSVTNVSLLGQPLASR